MISFPKFRDLVQRESLKAVDFGNYHWQIQGGAVIVNYYPTTKTIYVSGTTKGIRNCSVGKAIAFAKKGPEKPDTRSVRLPSYAKHKHRLMKVNPRCRWCGVLLTKSSATIDHIIPLSKGGSNFPDNLTLSCFDCNQSKADSMDMLVQQANAIRQIT
jgi:hypothetical protein